MWALAHCLFGKLFASCKKSRRPLEYQVPPSTTTSAHVPQIPHELPDQSHQSPRSPVSDHQIRLTSCYVMWCTIHHLLRDSVFDVLHKHRLGLNGKRRSDLGHLHNLKNISAREPHHPPWQKVCAPRGANLPLFLTVVVCHRAQNGKLPPDAMGLSAMPTD